MKGIKIKKGTNNKVSLEFTGKTGKTALEYDGKELMVDGVALGGEQESAVTNSFYRFDLEATAPLYTVSTGNIPMPTTSKCIVSISVDAQSILATQGRVKLYVSKSGGPAEFLSAKAQAIYYNGGASLSTSFYIENATSINVSVGNEFTVANNTSHIIMIDITKIG